MAQEPAIAPGHFGCSMSLRAAQAKALQQQLQALSLRWFIGHQQQTFTAAEGLFVGLSSSTGSTRLSSNFSSTGHMTTGHPLQHQQHSSYQQSSMGTTAHHQQQHQQKQQQRGGKVQQGGQKKRGLAGPATPSPSSSLSECCQLDRAHMAPASTKSAKRKAAEALLAARFGSGSIAAAAAPALPAAAAAQLQHKRHRSSLDSVINKFEGNSSAPAAAAAAGAAAGVQAAAVSSHSWDAAAAASAAAASTVQQNPQLAKLQQVLQQLQGRHHTMRQQQQQQQQPLQLHLQLQHTQQQQARQQQQQQDQEQELGAAVVAAAAGVASSPTAVEQAQQPHVQVAACAADCSHSLANGWCHTQVRLPHVDWGHVLEAELGGVPSFKLAPGYERIELPGGLQVLVVENAAYIGNALGALRASMQDPVVAIDLEWRPEFGRRFTPVAMVQLASSRVAVLIRTCRMSYKLPAVLKDFLKDPSISLLGFGWAASDEGKMQSTFGVGCKDFGRFLDLQAVAQGLGYCGFGLARLTRAVLGLALPKSKKVSMSNWELAQLSRAQVKYAALDVLVAGQVFRALRLWHSSPSLCEVCHYDLARVSSSSCSAGGGSSASGYMCSCGKGFRDIRGYLQHCERADHKPKWAECGGCGCARRLPWPSGMAKGQAGGGGSSRSSSEEGAE